MSDKFTLLLIKPTFQIHYSQSWPFVVVDLKVSFQQWLIYQVLLTKFKSLLHLQAQPPPQDVLSAQPLFISQSQHQSTPPGAFQGLFFEVRKKVK